MRKYERKKRIPELTYDINTIAGAGRLAILAGLNNREVVAAIQGAHPSFPARRAYFARWYRAQLSVLGMIPERLKSGR